KRFRRSGKRLTLGCEPLKGDLLAGAGSVLSETRFGELPHPPLDPADRTAGEGRQKSEESRARNTRRRRTERTHEPVHRGAEPISEACDILTRRKRRMRSAQRFEEPEEGAEKAEHHEQPDEIGREREGESGRRSEAERALDLIAERKGELREAQSGTVLVSFFTRGAVGACARL